MRRREDDLSAWADDPIIRALTASGTADELAGEEAVLAAFRDQAATSRRRFARRFGAGGATFAVAIALSGGVAAAYGHVLPTPIQRAAHDILGPVGVPAPGSSHGIYAFGRHHHRHSPVAFGPVPTPTSSRPAGVPATPGTSGSAPAPAPSADAKPQPGSHAPHASSTPTTLSGTASPNPGTTPTSGSTSSAPPPAPTPTPTPTRTQRAKPAKVTITLASKRVPNGDTDAVTGQLLDASGVALANRPVYLAQRVTGTHQWQRVATGTTDSSGYVTLTLPDVTHDVFVRLTAGNHVRTSGVRVIELPSMSVNPTRNGDSYDVTAIIDGAQVGDPVLVERLAKGTWVTEQTVTIGSTGAAQFSVPTPKGKRGRAAYRVVLKATRAHGNAQKRFSVTGPAPK